MKQYRIFVVVFIIIFDSSCSWHIFKKNEYPLTSRSEICVKVFDDTAFDFNKLKTFSVEQLLILQKCGLAYHPQYQLQNYIANQDEYPISKIIRHLQTEQDEDFQFHLILDIVAVTNSEKHNDKLRSDENLVLTEINKTIQNMQDENIRKISEIEFNKIKFFFESVK